MRADDVLPGVVAADPATVVALDSHLVLGGGIGGAVRKVVENKKLARSLN